MRGAIRRLAVALLLLPALAGAAPLDAIFRTLETYGPLNTQRVERAALVAALQAIDPHATLVPKSRPHPAPDADVPLLHHHERWPEDIVWLQFGGLSTTASNEAITAMRDVLEPTPTGVILDLRKAGGDNLDALDAVCGLFFTNDTAIYQLRDGYANVVTTHFARANSPPPTLPPVMLLIDGDTRGASEALAAVFKRHPGVMLLGAPTRGDSAQRVFLPFSNNEDLYIGTSWIVPIESADYFPNGVIPHIPITTNISAIATNTPSPMIAPAPLSTNALPGPSLAERIGDDVVLRRAADILLGLHALRQP